MPKIKTNSGAKKRFALTGKRSHKKEKEKGRKTCFQKSHFD